MNDDNILNFEDIVDGMNLNHFKDVKSSYPTRLWRQFQVTFSVLATPQETLADYITMSAPVLLYIHGQILFFVITMIQNKQHRGGPYAPHPNSLKSMRSGPELNLGKIDKSHLVRR